MSSLRFAVALVGVFTLGLALGSGAIAGRYAVDRGELAIGLVLKDPR